MIAKRIPRKKGTSSPARLVRYMVAAKGGLDPASWARTADYILDTQENTVVGERVSSYRVTNCATDDPAIATILIEAKQAENKKSHADKTYHLVFSFPHGENPSIDILHAIEDELCVAIGFSDHQRISAVHNDTGYLHVHVAINKVHPVGLQNIEPYYDKKRLMQACETIEIKYGLQRTHHGVKELGNEQQGSIKLGAEQLSRDRNSKFRNYLRQSYNISFDEPAEAETFNDLRTLSGCCLAHTAERNQVLLPGDACRGLGTAGESSSDRVRWARNGHRADAGHQGVDIEAKSGVETLTGYVAREVASALRAASSWTEIHTAAAGHGLEVNLRGAGLVIGDPGLPLWTKASSCGRDLSLKALSDRLGPYQPPAHKLPPTSSKAYTPGPRKGGHSSAALYAKYLCERQAQAAARRAGLAQIKRTGLEAHAQLGSWLNIQRTLLKAVAKGPVRRIMQGTLRQQFKASGASNSKALSQQKKALVARTTVPAWADWLAEQAERGNLDALAVLRGRDDVARQWHGDLLTAERADQAKAIVMDSLRPQVRKDGSVAYRTVDGGVVIDKHSYVHAQTATTGAAMVALELAAQKFAGQPLIVEGTDAVRAEVVALAGLHGVLVTFLDEPMERARQAGVRTKASETAMGKVQASQEQASKEGLETAPAAKAPTADQESPSQDGWKASAVASLDRSSQQPAFPKQFATGAKHSDSSAKTSQPVVTAWISERNALKAKISSIAYHRLWAAGDAGSFKYDGRRRMKDGSEVLLLRRANEVWVKPASVHVAAKTARWNIGKTVNLDTRGRFIGGNQGVEL